MSLDKERPILFSAPMVRAILDGRKTQTRRVAPISKLKIRQHDSGMLTWSVYFSKPVKGILSSHSGSTVSEEQAYRIIASQYCPYGKVGDRLWVRETWAPANSDDGPVILYRADGDRRYLIHEQDFLDDDGAFCYEKTGNVYFDAWASDIEAADMGWRPSIHIYRWASRIDLEITGIRVERLQDISEEDAISEGIHSIPFYPDDGFPLCDGWTWLKDDGKSTLYPTPSQAYKALYESINGQGSWDANPWIWVIDFKRVNP